MRRIDELLTEYGQSHQNETNKSIHWICVPLIFFSIMGLIASIPSAGLQQTISPGNPYANWATMCLVLVLIYYVTLSIPLSLGMMLFGLACLALANLIVKINIAPLWLVCVVI